MGLIADNNTTGRTIIVIGSIAGCLAIATVGLRVWVRRIVGANLDASDWTCVAGLVVAITLLGSTVNSKS
jgi:hypothetical protein